MTNLVNRNITLGRNRVRTSIRFEPELWKAVEEICYRENCITIHDWVEKVSANRPKGQSRTSAVRVAIVQYYMRLAPPFSLAEVLMEKEGHALTPHDSTSIVQPTA